MKITKQEIMLTALRLFAEKGYEATSVADIAGRLAVSKGAMYKHFDSKKHLFDCILAETEKEDRMQAESNKLPVSGKDEDAESYKRATLSDVFDFAKRQFEYWTENEFAVLFRRLLTVEQFGNEDMRKLYQQYFCKGPLGYVVDLFSEVGVENAEQNAFSLWSAMCLGYGLSDEESDKSKVKNTVFQALDDVYRKISRGEK